MSLKASNSVFIFFYFFLGSTFLHYVCMSFKALPFPLSVLWSSDIFPFEFNHCLEADSFYVCHVLFYLESETVPGPRATTQTHFSVEIFENLDLAPS